MLLLVMDLFLLYEWASSFYQCKSALYSEYVFPLGSFSSLHYVIPIFGCSTLHVHHTLLFTSRHMETNESVSDAANERNQ